MKIRPRSGVTYDWAGRLKTPIVMVHGAFCGGWAFERFRAPFEAAGHQVTALDLPGHAPKDVAENAPTRSRGSVSGTSMSTYARAVRESVEAQSKPPVLIGHSLGGLVAQMAASRSPVAGLILLAPSSPWGVSGSSVEEAMAAMALYALGPFWALAVEPDYPSARRYLFDRLSKEQRRATFHRLTPESGRALWETLNWWLDPFATTLVPAKGVRAPVLAMAGGKDAIHPPSTVRATAERLAGETRVFAEMSHWLVGEPGWEDVAGECLDWVASIGDRRAA
jgi:pimeloyl-ACP methyl ester carboxylesterase